MNALDKIRRQGFILRPANDDLYVEPIDALSEAQRRWLIDNKRQILADLSAERWQLFVSLCIEHDVSADEVQARFKPDDKIDLVAEPDDKLPLHAKTIADDIKRTRTPQELIKHDIATSDVPNLVRAIHAPRIARTCGGCQHFKRHDWHKNLGSCSIRAEPEAAAGHWDSDNRSYCLQWVAS